MMFVAKYSSSAVRSIRNWSMTRPITASMEQLLAETMTPKDPRLPPSSQPVRELCRRYQDLREEDKINFVRLMAAKYDIDRKQARVTAASYIENLANDTHQDIPAVRLEEKLRSALTPQYMGLFTQIGKLEGGVKFLVDMRGNLMEFISKQQGSTDVSGLRSMSSQLKELLSLWFSAGLMKVEKITWQSPCQMLQKISEYEAVHPVRGWLDLKRRVGSYRRCFVFTHSTMPHEPLVVLHTALMQHIADSIKDIVRHHKSHDNFLTSSPVTSLSASVEDLEDAEQVKAAIFYSITSTQKGLQGIELGKYLIKSAVKDLQIEYPHLNTFSTLSPIPGFRDWLLNDLVQVTRGSRPCPLTSQELQDITDEKDQGEALAMFHEMIKTHLWYRNEVLMMRLKAPLMRLCSHYLYVEKHRALALNGVANFHLKNGAVVWRINWLADTSQRGLNNSCSLMVNYRYFLDQIDTNSTQYCSQGTIAASEQVLGLVKTTSSL